jgi:hypothetical protein
MLLIYYTVDDGQKFTVGKFRDALLGCVEFNLTYCKFY